MRSDRAGQFLPGLASLPIGKRRILFKVLLPPIAAVACIVALGASSHFFLMRQGDALHTIFNRVFVEYISGSKVMSAVRHAHAKTYTAVNWMSSGYEEKRIKALVEQIAKDLNGVQKEIDGLVSRESPDSRDRGQWQELASEIAKYRKSCAETLDMASLEPATALMMLAGTDDLYESLSEKLQRLAKQQEEVISENYTEAKAGVSSLLKTTTWVTVSAVCISLLITLLVSRAITRPLSQLIERVKDIHEGGGDLTKRVTLRSRDEIGVLAGQINGLMDNLTEIVTEVQDSARGIGGISQDLNSSARATAESMEEQSMKVDQIATAAVEMSQTVADIAQHTHHIATSASSALKRAAEGKAIVGSTAQEVRAMSAKITASCRVVSDLGERSKQIGEIVDVISDIADQTNLLALNAAIEAARAGEQGRGFAVVADEVRKLAEKTGKATTDILDKIRAIQEETSRAIESLEDSLGRVTCGVELSEKAGNSLHSIVESATSLQGMVDQIAAATEEMSTTAQHISTDLESIASVTHQITDTSGKTCSSSEELSRLSSVLQTAVQRFKTEDASG